MLGLPPPEAGDDLARGQQEHDDQRQCGDKVRTSLSLTWPSTSLVTSASGEAGAAALAIRWHTGTPVSQPVLEALQAGRSD